MLKILLKKQMTEIFRAYFYDAKKNRKRSPLSVALLFVMYALLVVGFLGGLFAFLAVTLCAPMVSAGMGWVYFTLMGLLSIAMGAFGSVFNTFSALYLPKDNDLLLSLPIPVRSIILSRLLGVYLLGLMYSGVVMLPAVIVYLILAPFSVSTLIGCLLLLVLISLIVLILSCALGWLVAKISLKLKNKSFITVIISLVFIGVYYFCYFKAQTLISELIANLDSYAQKLKGAAYPLYLFGRIGEGDWLAMLTVGAVVVVLFALTCLLLSHSYLRIATSGGKSDRVRYREERSKSKSVAGALLGKEFGRFTSSANYMLNCGMAILFLLILAVFVFIKGDVMTAIIAELAPEDNGVLLAVFSCTAICAAASMNDMVVPSVSLEGKNLWLLQSLPVTPWQVLRAKLSVQWILTAPATLICSVCVVVALRIPPAWAAVVLILPQLCVLLAALFGLFLGLKMPNLTWTSEITPIKQGANVMLALFFGWGYAVLFCGLYFLVGKMVGAPVYVTLFAALTLGASALLYRWLRKTGCRIFETL